MNKKIILTLVLILLLINTSLVFGSWYDWSRYEHEGYSFKIPEGYKVGAKLQAEWGDDYLVEDWGYNDPGTSICIYTQYDDVYDRYSEGGNVKEIRKHNDTSTIYSYDNGVIGEIKTNNGTTILIELSHSRFRGNYTENRKYYEERYVDIIEGMFDSVRVDN